MKIFVSHSSSYDFRNELYKPLKEAFGSKHELFLPHESKPSRTEEIIKESDIIMAEVSYPSTGQGIELGWASCHGKRIIAIRKRG